MSASHRFLLDMSWWCLRYESSLKAQNHDCQESSFCIWHNFVPDEFVIYRKWWMLSRRRKIDTDWRRNVPICNLFDWKTWRTGTRCRNNWNTDICSNFAHETIFSKKQNPTLRNARQWDWVTRVYKDMSPCIDADRCLERSNILCTESIPLERGACVHDTSSMPNVDFDVEARRWHGHDWESDLSIHLTVHHLQWWIDRSWSEDEKPLQNVVRPSMHSISCLPSVMCREVFSSRSKICLQILRNVSSQMRRHIQWMS